MVVISSQKSFVNSQQPTSSIPKLVASKVINPNYIANSIIPKLVVSKVINPNYVTSSTVHSLGGKYYSQSNIFQGITKLKATAYIHGYAHDYLSSLVRFFGEGFRQDANYFYINKTALPGLTLHSQNTAESLLTALLLRVKDYESNSLISRVIVEHWKTQPIKVNNKNLIMGILLVKLYVLAKYEYLAIVNDDEPITPNNILN